MEDIEQTKINTITNEVKVSKGYFYNDYRRYEQGFTLGAGASFKHFNIALRTQFTNGISLLNDTASPVRVFSLSAGYIF